MRDPHAARTPHIACPRLCCRILQLCAAAVALPCGSPALALETLSASPLSPPATGAYSNSLLLGSGTATLSPDFTGGSHAMDTAKDLTKGVVLSGALTAGLTLAIDRAQPHNGMDSFRAQTSAAFAVAPILASRYGWKAGMPAYTLAFMSGFGGANDGKYSTSGALASAAVGLAVGGAVAHHRRTQLMPEHVYMGKRGLGLKFGF